MLEFCFLPYAGIMFFTYTVIISTSYKIQFFGNSFFITGAPQKFLIPDLLKSQSSLLSQRERNLNFVGCFCLCYCKMFLRYIRSIIYQSFFQKLAETRKAIFFRQTCFCEHIRLGYNFTVPLKHLNKRDLTQSYVSENV